MNKKLVLVAVATFILASFHRAEAQQPTNVTRIGFHAAPSRTGMSHLTEPFLQGLRELGYVEGKNIAIGLPRRHPKRVITLRR